jgi:hypothetical protein
MKLLQDATINSSFKEHKSQEKKLIDEAQLKKLNDLDLKEILDKRSAELNQAEKVVLTLHMINQQVANIDGLVSKVCADSEKDFLNAYSGHMGMVMRELHAFKRKIN